ncbi:MAG: MBOAT family O-acyltransferase [Sarcina sp.]
MVFSSIIFLFTFLPFALFSYYLIPRKFKNLVLLLFSLIFYAFGEPIYIVLMIFTTIFDYFMGIFIGKNLENKKKSKFLLIFTICVNLLILGFFKYFGFLIENINIIFSLDLSYKTLPLPIGISFYTFQTLSYIIDVYLKKVSFQKNIISFSLYVTMFPQLIAGPIVRYKDVNKQLDCRIETPEKFGQGVERFILGLSKKVLLANNIGFIWTSISSQDLSLISPLTAWLGILSFSFQIYFDFSAYSDMAIGLGKMFGFDFIENFNYPYTSKSITEFWRRWHISLGSWFREYVYIPLGGNRCSFLKQCRNLFIVWLITGLWHGASWNFIVWGLYYGLILFIEKNYLKNILEKLPSFLAHFYTMFLVIIGWVFFASPTLSYAFSYIKIMFFAPILGLLDSISLYYLISYLLVFVLLLLFSTPIPKFYFDKLVVKYNNLALASNMIIFFFSIAYLVTETYNPFLYFRF